MFLLALFFMSIFSTSVTPIPPHSDRYNHHKKTRINHQDKLIHKAPERTTPQDEMEEFTPDEFNDFELDLLDATPHTPLGTICIEITEYCNYFIQHCMDGPLLNKQREALALFCNVLKLLTNLADSDCAIIRLDSYISNIIEIIQALENASKQDDAILMHRAEFPLIASLQSSHDEPNDDESNTAFLIHNALRAPNTAKPLISELFLELKSYTYHKLHAVLDRFKQDTQQLLTISQHEDTSQPAGISFTLIEQKSMESLSWLCRHASSTCNDLTQTMSSSTLYAHTGALMTQIQQMLSAMALTYNHLGTNKVRSQDRSSLARRYASMLELLNMTPPHRTSQSVIAHINTLHSPQEKETFITNLFAAPRESELFLGEFFPSFSHALEYNLEQFCNTLTEQVTETFTKRYWLSQQ